jgi:surface antigen
MRKSVLTGLFACGLILATSTASASAESFDSRLFTNKQDQKTTIASLLTIVKSDSVDVIVADVTNGQTETITDSQQTTEIIPKHIVVEGESLSDIAKKHATEWKRIYDKNTNIQDPDIIKAGMELLIPAADEQLAPRELPVRAVVAAPREVASAPRTVATQAVQARTVQQTPASSAGNGYVAGYCTWYVKNKRPDLPNNLGNASTWVSRAAAQGIATGSTPAVGAVGQRGNHVVYVESVNDDGTVTISEMNHKGLYVTTTRTLPADYFRYIY